MKKLLPIFISAALITACNSAPKPGTADAANLPQQSVSADTAGLAKFQLWKAQNELADAEQYNQPAKYEAPVQEKVRTIYRTVPAKSSSAPKKASSTSKPSSNSTVSTGTSSGVGSGTSESAGEAKQTVKKGISKAAKGAIIGGVGGAIAGAVINKKNRVAGAVIGGVIGAGGGYAIGRGMDKKDGRVGSGSGTSTPPFSIPTGIFQK